jgi:hypothetical protein
MNIPAGGCLEVTEVSRDNEGQVTNPPPPPLATILYKYVCSEECK